MRYRYMAVFISFYILATGVAFLSVAYVDTLQSLSSLYKVKEMKEYNDLDHP